MLPGARQVRSEGEVFDISVNMVTRDPGVGEASPSRNQTYYLSPPSNR